MQFGNKILVREINNGTKDKHSSKFSPKLFVQTHKETKYKSLFGGNLEEMSFLDINDAKEFLKTYKETENFPIYGNTSYAYQYITENYPGDVDYDISELKILTIDIETSSENGFPSIENPIEEVLLITLQDNVTKQITTFGVGEFDKNKIQHIKGSDKFVYVKCSDESDLLKRFLLFWDAEQPDIITGWNVQLFDLPYLMVRIPRVLGEGTEKNLSPWKVVNRRNITINGREFLIADLFGVSVLDYLDLYKKFTYTAQESYKLDYIAQVELGQKKLETEYETFKDFYTNDWHNFVEYNVIDVELVDALEDKMKLIELAVTMAYDAKCNFTDIFSAVRTWDCILYNHLWNKNIVVPPKMDREGRTIAGAYVKEPIPGKYDWVVSFDAASLYPSIIMQYNMSPETLTNHGMALDATPELLLSGKSFDLEDVAMAANGYCYRKDMQGLFPEIVEKIFSERVFYKKKMIEAQREYEKTKDVQQSKLISKYNNIQMARKIQLNSLYGAWANQYFRFYDDRIAEGITLTGQYIIQYIGKALDNYLNKICKTENVEYTFYSDTDSCYVTLENLVNTLPKDVDKNKIATMLDTFAKEKISKILDKACEEISQQTNAYQNKMEFKREVIADRAIWVAKKRYALNVYDSEGVRYKEPKLKVQGLEIVRSSTPSSVREYLRDAVKMALTSSEQELQSFIKEVEDKFMKMNPEDIAFPRSANNLSKYHSGGSIYTKGTPLHVRGSLLYNHHIKKNNLDRKYETIKEGDKIKYLYLKEPNPIRENTISFIAKLPKELDLHRYVDYNTMFEKTFLDPMKTIVDGLGWNTRPIATLDDLF